MSNSYDVIVLGVGSMGAATCYQLAKRGANVLGLEQFDIAHENGSHHGQSRIIRKAYFEHHDYVPLLERSYELWSEIENESNSQLMYQKGLLYIGPRQHQVLNGVENSSNLYGIQIKHLDKIGISKSFPQFLLPNHFEGIWEQDAGFVLPEKSIRTFTKQATKNGADIHTSEKTISWEPVKNSNEIKVVTNKGKYFCKKLIVTAGAYTCHLLPELKNHLVVTQQIIAWFKPKNRGIFSLEKFPCWTLVDEQNDRIFYGMPILPSDNEEEALGIKIGHHSPGTSVDPNHRIELSSKIEEIKLISFLEKYIPNANGSLQMTKSCLYTNTRDENFIIDQYTQNPNVIYASGFSGHGFKFAPVIGEILADLSIDNQTSLPIDFLRFKRLSKL